MNAASPLARDLIHRLKHGFHAEIVEGGYYNIVNDDGVPFRRPDGRPIRIGGDDNQNTRARQIKQLVEIGAIDPIKQRSTRGAKLNPHPKTKSTNTDNPILLARAVLSDPRSNPRERKLAQQNLHLVETLVKMQGRVKSLGETLSHYEDILERRSA